MDGAAFFTKEMALAVARHAQPEQVPGAIHVAALEVSRPHPHELGHARQIVFRDVNKPLLTATIGAAGLAFES
jgi:hypothetical protein